MAPPCRARSRSSAPASAGSPRRSRCTRRASRCACSSRRPSCGRSASASTCCRTRCASSRSSACATALEAAGVRLRRARLLHQARSADLARAARARRGLSAGRRSRSTAACCRCVLLDAVRARLGADARRSSAAHLESFEARAGRGVCARFTERAEWRDRRARATAGRRRRHPLDRAAQLLPRRRPAALERRTCCGARPAARRRS